MDAFTWTHLGIIIAGAGLVLTLWRIRAADHERIDGRFDALKSIIDMHHRELSEHKVHVAQLHPTMKELGAIEQRLTDAITRLTERIDRILARHD